MIPAYQAEGSIGPLVRAIVAQNLPVIVVDDASSDQTSAKARRAGARVITRRVNGGKGTALRQGCAAALADRFRWVLIMDADGQHLPSEIPLLLKAAACGEVDLILGNRMSHPKGMPWERRLTNRLMSSILSALAHQRITDTQCGFRLVSSSVLEGIKLTSERFEIDSELVVKAARAGFRICSVPVSSIYQRNVSFIRPFQDTGRFIRFLFSVRRSPRP